MAKVEIVFTEAVVEQIPSLERKRLKEEGTDSQSKYEGHHKKKQYAPFLKS